MGLIIKRDYCRLHDRFTINSMYDLRMSEAARPLYEKVKTFIAEEIEPKTAEFFRLGGT